MRRFLLAALALVPLPAHADDAADVAACLGNALATGTAPAACIGPVSSACIDAIATPDYVAAGACVAREAAAWDVVLNDEWKALMGLLTQAEKDMIRDAQRAWIAYRDADCRVAAQLAHPSRSGLWGSQCLLDRTAERVIALRNIALDRGN